MATVRPGRPPSVCVVNAGVLPHPVSGPTMDDPLPGSAQTVPQLLRDIYTAAGGTHPDLAEYDRVMAAERRTAVLLHPDRFTTTPLAPEHQEHE